MRNLTTLSKLLIVLFLTGTCIIFVRSELILGLMKGVTFIQVIHHRYLIYAAVFIFAIIVLNNLELLSAILIRNFVRIDPDPEAQEHTCTWRKSGLHWQARRKNIHLKWENEVVTDSQEFFYGLPPEEEKAKSIQRLRELVSMLEEQVERIKQVRFSAEHQRTSLHSQWAREIKRKEKNKEEYATSKSYKTMAHLFCAIDLKINKLTKAKNKFEKNITDINEKIIKLQTS